MDESSGRETELPIETFQTPGEFPRAIRLLIRDDAATFAVEQTYRSRAQERHIATMRSD